MSMLLCNCLALLGFDSYMLSGKIIKDNNEEEHQFVITKSSKGEFILIDAAQYCIITLENVYSPEDLLYLQDIQGINGKKDNIAYYSYLSYNNKKNKIKI